MNFHANAAARAQRDERLRHNRLPRLEFEVEALREGRRNQRRLHQSKSLTNAAARAAAKWKICVRGKTRGQSIEPALGAERERLGKIARVAMHDPLRHQKRGACWERITSQFKWFDGNASDDVCGRIKAQRFANHGVEVREQL